MPKSRSTSAASSLAVLVQAAIPTLVRPLLRLTKTRSVPRSKAATWCSSPPAKVAVPAPVLLRLSPTLRSRLVRSPLVWSLGRSPLRVAGARCKLSRASPASKKRSTPRSSSPMIGCSRSQAPTPRSSKPSASPTTCSSKVCRASPPSSPRRVWSTPTSPTSR